MTTEVIKSLLFHEHRDTTVILEFSTEQLALKQFRKKTFYTDRYIDILSWERIISKLDVVMETVIAQKLDWKKNPKGILPLEPYENMMNLKVKYKFTAKEESYVNLEKVEYNLDWIMKISILRSKEPKKTPPKPLSAIVPKPTTANEDENVIMVNDYQYETSDYDESPIEKRAKISIKSSPKKCSTLDRWLTKPHPSKSNPNVTKRKKEVKRKISERPPAQSSRSPLESIDPYQMQRLDEFNEKQNQEDRLVAARKEELKDLEILNCQDCTNEDLKLFVRSRKDEILMLYDKPHNSRSKITINGIDIDFVIMTSSQVITEKQHMFIMREVEKLREESVRSTKETISSDVVMPYLIIELFRQVHKFSFEEAVDRIKSQVEKIDFFNADLFDSF